MKDFIKEESEGILIIYVYVCKRVMWERDKYICVCFDL